MKDVTAAVIRDADGNYLVFRRAPGENLEGFWEFPGGKVEAGETLQQCLERELMEELGIRTRAGAELASVTHGDKLRLIALECEILEGTPRLTVHDAMKAVPFAQLASCGLAPLDKKIVCILAAGR